MIILIFACISLIILVPILYFFPLGINVKGKALVAAAALAVSLIGLVANRVMALGQSVLISILLLFPVIYLFNKKLDQYFVVAPEKNRVLEHEGRVKEGGLIIQDKVVELGLTGRDDVEKSEVSKFEEMGDTSELDRIDLGEDHLELEKPVAESMEIANGVLFEDIEETDFLEERNLFLEPEEIGELEVESDMAEIEILLTENFETLEHIEMDAETTNSNPNSQLQSLSRDEIEFLLGQEDDKLLEIAVTSEEVIQPEETERQAYELDNLELDIMTELEEEYMELKENIVGEMKLDENKNEQEGLFVPNHSQQEVEGEQTEESRLNELAELDGCEGIDTDDEKSDQAVFTNDAEQVAFMSPPLDLTPVDFIETLELLDTSTTDELENGMEQLSITEQELPVVEVALKPEVEETDVLEVVNEDQVDAESNESLFTGDKSPQLKEANQIQNDMFQTMLTQLELARHQLKPNQFADLVESYLHPDMPAQDYYTFATVAINHYIQNKDYVRLQLILGHLKNKFTQYEIIIQEIQFIENRFCYNTM